MKYPAGRQLTVSQMIERLFANADMVLTDIRLKTGYKFNEAYAREAVHSVMKLMEYATYSFTDVTLFSEIYSSIPYDDRKYLGLMEDNPMWTAAMQATSYITSDSRVKTAERLRRHAYFKGRQGDKQRGSSQITNQKNKDKG